MIIVPFFGRFVKGKWLKKYICSKNKSIAKDGNAFKTVVWTVGN